MLDSILIWVYNRGTDGTEGTDGACDLMQINGNGNVYEQIVEHYRKYISLGVLQEGEKMPSCRELAIEIGVNHKTVERAYQQLVSEELIESIPKKGYFVRKKEKKTIPSGVVEVLKKLKENDVKKEEILEALELVYRGEDNDRN